LKPIEGINPCSAASLVTLGHGNRSVAKSRLHTYFTVGFALNLQPPISNLTLTCSAAYI